MSYREDRAWSDAFIPAIRRIVGPHLLEPSSLEVDTQQAADLVVLRARDMTIACRVRRHGYEHKYPWDFTIRARRDSGAKTEFSKIVSGWGDWMLYGHEDPAVEAQLSRWFLIDLHEFRAELIRDGYRVRRRYPDPKSPIPNGDGTYFLAYDVRVLPPVAVIASSHSITKTKTPPELCQAAS